MAALAIRVVGSTLLLVAGLAASAQDRRPKADFLFVGSYHMSNPGHDVHNLEADDVLSEKRQREVRHIAALLGRYRPTKVMVEVETSAQTELDQRFAESCRGARPLSRNEVEQLGFRIACNAKLGGVLAVGWNELGPFKGEESVDYAQAAERHGQGERYREHLAIGKESSALGQRILREGTVLDMLRHLNSGRWLSENAASYFRVGLFGTAADPIGANWLQLWFGRNLTIFNNVVRRTEPGDRVLVLYGAGHGNALTELARDSGFYRVHDALAWLGSSRKRRA